MATEAEAFKVFLDFVWQPENDGARKDAAPGETFDTVRGVTQMTWTGAQQNHVVPADVTLEDSTDDQLADVLHWCCWQIPGAEKLAGQRLGALAVVVANMAMAAGAGTAVKMLQETVGNGLAVDGGFGPHTLAAVTQAAAEPGRDLVGQYTQTCLRYYASLANAPRFLHGWTRRANACEAAARALV